ncbi:MAG: ThiF family adenylyltransferase [Bradymonadales bacterium]|nr:ThiF family adenylyltransferase [Bradymonadales bacterium]
MSSRDTLHSIEPDRFFDRTRHLLGTPAMDRIGRGLVMVVGLGGVGSWAAEMLIRNGVRRIILVDFDVVAPTDFNRQVQAVPETMGMPKAMAMASRLRAIWPPVEVEAIVRRFDRQSADEILDHRPDCVLDAIDLMTDKALLIDTCLTRRIPIVTTMGAATRRDPTRIEVVDLSKTRIDPMAREVRDILRRKYGRPLTEPVGVPAVMTTEPRCCQPTAPRHDEPGPTGEMPRKKPVEGSSGCVTAAFGLAAAAEVLKLLAGDS